MDRPRDGAVPGALALDASGVRALLPQAPPFVFLDDAPEVVPGVSVWARYLVPERTFWTDGHFPAHPVMPGALLLEAMAQACSLAWLTLPQADGLPALVGADSLRFRAPALPGAPLDLRVEVVDRRRLWRFRVTVDEGDRRIADAELIATRLGRGAAAP